MLSRAQDRAFPLGVRQLCPVLAADIADFSSPARDEEIREAMNADLHRVIGDAVAASGIDWKSCYRQDEGDGVLVVMPTSTCPDRLIDSLPGQLRFQVRRANHKASQAAQMRLRVAVDIGLIKRTAHGVHGDSLIGLSRMLNADPLREALDESGAELAMAFSDYLYRTVVLDAPSLTSPAEFTPFDCMVKKTSVHGWLRVPSAER